VSALQQLANQLMNVTNQQQTKVSIRQQFNAGDIARLQEQISSALFKQDTINKGLNNELNSLRKAVVVIANAAADLEERVKALERKAN